MSGYCLTARLAVITRFSFTNSNGFSGSVTNPSTTPTLALDVAALDAAKIANGSVSNTEYQYLDGVTSPIQTQLNALSSTLAAAVGILVTVNGINGKAVANTSLYTVPAGKTCIVIGYTVRCSAASAITVGPAAGIGNIAGTSNISASQGMNALLTTSDSFLWTLYGMSKVTTAGGQIYFNLGTAATGTSQTLSVDLMGYNL